MIKINKNDAPLYMDVICADCKKRMALSNAHEVQGVYYCERHVPFGEDQYVELLVALGEKRQET